MNKWLHHIHRSPLCYRTYPGLITKGGHFACPCGWTEEGSMALDDMVRRLSRVAYLDLGRTAIYAAIAGGGKPLIKR